MAIDLDENLDIRIEEVRGKKKVGVRGDFSLERRGEIRELVNNYGDALVRLYEINIEYSGLERRWHIGKVVEEEVETHEEEANLSKLVEYSPFELESAWSLRRYNNFYNMFPDGDFDPDISPSKYDELATNERMEKGSALAYERFKKHADRTPTVWEIRAWAKMDSYADIEDVVKQVYEEGMAQTEGLEDNPQKLIVGVENVLIMSGEHPDSINTDVIERLVRDLLV